MVSNEWLLSEKKLLVVEVFGIVSSLCMVVSICVFIGVSGVVLMVVIGVMFVDVGSVVWLILLLLFNGYVFSSVNCFGIV